MCHIDCEENGMIVCVLDTTFHIKYLIYGNFESRIVFIAQLEYNSDLQQTEYLLSILF